MDEEVAPRCAVRAWSPKVAGVREVLHARIVDFAYPAHCHDTWTVLVVDDGAVEFRQAGRSHLAHGGAVTLLPPGVAHDGRPASGALGGFRKRSLYLEPEVLSSDLVGPAVDRTTLKDRNLRSALDVLHRTLMGPIDPFEVDELLTSVCERITRHLAATERHEPEPQIAARLRALLDETYVSPLPLQATAALFGRSVGHLVRSFTRAFGVSPLAYVTGRRIDHARALLLDGMRPAEVAATVGFYDEAHLHRHFRRHLPVSPGAYAGVSASKRRGA